VDNGDGFDSAPEISDAFPSCLLAKWGMTHKPQLQPTNTHQQSFKKY
jgi:hypothetical protein